MRDATTASLAAAKRGRRSERAWADVSRAADIARAKGVMVKVHGIEVMPLSLPFARRPADLAERVVQKPADAAVPKQPSEAVDEASPPPLSKRKQRSAQRLMKFQEKKEAPTELFTASRMHPKNKCTALVFSADFCFFGRTRIARERLGAGQPELYENAVRLVESFRIKQGHGRREQGC